MLLTPTENEAEHGAALGWITMVEMFLVVAAMLLGTVALLGVNLNQTKAKLRKADAKIDELKKSLEEAEKQRTTLLALIKALERDLSNAQAALVKTRDQLLAARKERDQAVKARARLEQVAEDLEKARQREEIAVKRANELERKWKTEQGRAAEAARQLLASRGQVSEKEAELQKVRERLATLLVQGKKADEKIAALDTVIRSYENRFEGIRLEGEKVVFLVDRSGSMGYLTPDKASPKKWPFVCDTIGQVMKSIPGLKQYQVILVSDNLNYPLEHAGEWLAYDRTKTSEEVVKRLKEIPPRGRTNLYSGLEAAFAYRDKGLSAIYLFSDGLPNEGPGLTPAQERKFRALDQAGKLTLQDEVEMGQLLGQHLRKEIREKWNKEGKVRVDSIGFFYDSPDLGSFLWSLSRENGGNFVGMSKP